MHDLHKLDHCHLTLKPSMDKHREMQTPRGIHWLANVRSIFWRERLAAAQLQTDIALSECQQAHYLY